MALEEALTNPVTVDIGTMAITPLQIACGTLMSIVAAVLTRIALHVGVRRPLAGAVNLLVPRFKPSPYFQKIADLLTTAPEGWTEDYASGKLRRPVAQNRSDKKVTITKDGVVEVAGLGVIERMTKREKRALARLARAVYVKYYHDKLDSIIEQA